MQQKSNFPAIYKTILQFSSKRCGLRTKLSKLSDQKGKKWEFEKCFFWKIFWSPSSLCFSNLSSSQGKGQYNCCDEPEWIELANCWSWVLPGHERFQRGLTVLLQRRRQLGRRGRVRFRCRQFAAVCRKELRRVDQLELRLRCWVASRRRQIWFVSGSGVWARAITSGTAATIRAAAAAASRADDVVVGNSWLSAADGAAFAADEVHLLPDDLAIDVRCQLSVKDTDQCWAVLENNCYKSYRLRSLDLQRQPSTCQDLNGIWSLILGKRQSL